MDKEKASAKWPKVEQVFFEWKLDFDQMLGLYSGPIRSAKFGVAGISFELGLQYDECSATWFCAFGIRLCDNEDFPLEAICKITAQNQAREVYTANEKVVISNSFIYFPSAEIASVQEYFDISWCLNVKCEVAFPTQDSAFRRQCLDETIALSNYKLMCNNAVGADCVFKIGNKELKAHRCILAHHSEVFKVMFANESMLEAKTGVINIVDADFKSVAAMLAYLYYGSTVALIENAEGVLCLAEKYAIEPLKEVCFSCLTSRLTKESFFSTALLADLYSNAPLLEQCADYMRVNKTALLKLDSWREFKKSHPEAAFRLLELCV